MRNIPIFSASPGCLFPRSELVGLPHSSKSHNHRPYPHVASSYIKTTDSNHSGLLQSSYSSTSSTIGEDNALDELIFLLSQADQIRQDLFYGRCLGFYLAPGAQKLFRIITSIMAGYADSFKVRTSFILILALFEQGILSNRTQCFWITNFWLSGICSLLIYLH
ncbi:unnamed protein product [Protopolystoma xenopodis]|uniref:Hormone-sensitive lipase N-terminal domain-containing protein n=1 Tax=Protopolystoma xenopodis TaxID=117903 RepID=A0A448WHE7_9PLAT|nr:unnamed protein product [Protopolystoma xenopodis]